MPGFVKGALAFVAGLVLAWLAAMVIYVIGGELGWWRDRDGGVAMGFAFTIGPFFGVIAGIVAAIWAVRRGKVVSPPVAHAVSSAPATFGPEAKLWPKAIRVPLAAIIAGGAAYLAGILVFWVFAPYSGSSYAPMGQLLWNAPAWLGIGVALGAAIREMRR
ncbi:MAG: hypothetical protein MUF11_11570 [Beijerinckiaceae bacterium]|jgi:hypothetical protein|nr:hypothetical protein [Beijerinckiaceae bacterium]